MKGNTLLSGVAYLVYATATRSLSDEAVADRRETWMSDRQMTPDEAQSRETGGKAGEFHKNKTNTQRRKKGKETNIVQARGWENNRTISIVVCLCT